MDQHPQRKRDLSRRDFLLHSGLSVAVLGGGFSCNTGRFSSTHAESPPSDTAGTVENAHANSGVGSAPNTLGNFPIVEAAGSPEDVGLTIGRATAELIRSIMAQQREWFDSLRTFAFENRENRYTPFVAATERHHPEVMAELRGIARGAELPFEDVMVWNLQPELGTMRSQPARAGCSTIHLAAGGRLLIAHNEDGNNAFRHCMVILRVRPENKPAFTCLHYPGLTPGQVPAWNDAGLAVTTNFISTTEVRPGIPRYVLGRAVHGCSTIEEAQRIATNPERAFAFTLHLGSVHEGRLACLEVAPQTHDFQESSGLFIHTNHLVLPQTRHVPQRPLTPESSSGSRFQVLSHAVSNVAPELDLDESFLLRLLSSHEAVRQPYSPCRHADESSEGQTLATALLDIRTQRFSLFEGNPCAGRRRELELMT